MFTFGKYKNKSFEEVISIDKNYCKWVLSRQNCNNTNMIEFQNYIKNNYPTMTVRDDIPKDMINCSKLCEYYKTNVQLLRLFEGLTIQTIKLGSLTNQLDIPPNLNGVFVDYLFRYRISFFIDEIFNDRRCDSILTEDNYLEIDEDKKEIIEKSYYDIRNNSSENYHNDLLNISLSHSIFFGDLKCFEYLDFIKNNNIIYNNAKLDEYILNKIENKTKVLCNPVVGNSKLKIKGDADLIVDEELIDIKCSKFDIGSNIKDFIQLFFYVCLYYQNTKIKCTKITILNTKLNIEHFIDLINWDNYDKIISILGERII